MFKEKADPQVLKKCFDFIEKNKDTEMDTEVSRKALNLCSELISSILASHKEFEDAIKTEIVKMNQLDDGPKKDAFISEFNNHLNLSIALDQKAHEVLSKLEKIRIRNR